MKILIGFICATTLWFSNAILADDRSMVEAENLLSVMGMEKALSDSMEKLLQVQIEQNPELTPFKTVMLEFFARYMSYQKLKPHFIRMYAESFTAEELKDLNAFYQTPTGQKAIVLMPTLMSKGAELGASMVQEHLPELQQMIRDEAERIKATQKPQL